MSKTRLDLLLVERGLAESRSQAQRLVMAGQVRVNGQVALKPSAGVDASAEITLYQPPPYVSRGGEKLAAALQAFDISPKGLTCADVGASTGGFTDCLLQHGAMRVYAIDVGQGILHWKLRQDQRVVVMEKTNARYLERLPEPISLVTIDASFISLKILLPVVRGWLPPRNNPSSFHHASGHYPPEPSTFSPNSSSFPRKRGKEEERGVLDQSNHLLALIKPQFEAGRKDVARGDGVIRDPEIHRQVLLDVLSYAVQQGFAVRGLLRSPLLGPKGNVEFLAWLRYPAPQFTAGPGQQLCVDQETEAANLSDLVEGVVPLTQT